MSLIISFFTIFISLTILTLSIQTAPHGVCASWIYKDIQVWKPIESGLLSACRSTLNDPTDCLRCFSRPTNELYQFDYATESIISICVYKQQSCLATYDGKALTTILNEFTALADTGDKISVLGNVPSSTPVTWVSMTLELDETPAEQGIKITEINRSTSYWTYEVTSDWQVPVQCFYDITNVAVTDWSKYDDFIVIKPGDKNRVFTASFPTSRYDCLTYNLYLNCRALPFVDVAESVTLYVGSDIEHNPPTGTCSAVSEATSNPNEVVDVPDRPITPRSPPEQGENINNGIGGNNEQIGVTNPESKPGDSDFDTGVREPMPIWLSSDPFFYFVDDIKEIQGWSYENQIKKIKQLPAELLALDKIVPIFLQIIKGNKLMSQINCFVNGRYEECSSEKQKIQNELIKKLFDHVNPNDIPASLIDTADASNTEQQTKLYLQTLITVFNVPESFTVALGLNLIELTTNIWKNFKTIVSNALLGDQNSIVKTNILVDLVAWTSSMISSSFQTYKYLDAMDGFVSPDDKGKTDGWLRHEVIIAFKKAFMKYSKTWIEYQRETSANHFTMYYKRLSFKDTDTNLRVLQVTPDVSNEDYDVYAFQGENLSVSVPRKAMWREYNDIQPLGYSVIFFKDYPFLSYKNKSEIFFHKVVSVREYAIDDQDDDIRNNIIYFDTYIPWIVKYTQSGVTDYKNCFSFEYNQFNLYNEVEIVSAELVDDELLMCKTTNWGDIGWGNFTVEKGLKGWQIFLIVFFTVVPVAVFVFLLVLYKKGKLFVDSKQNKGGKKCLNEEEKGINEGNEGNDENERNEGHEGHEGNEVENNKLQLKENSNNNSKGLIGSSSETAKDKYKKIK